MLSKELKENHWTYSEYAALDDDVRYEVLDGELVVAPAPDSLHQKASRDLEFLLWQFIKEKNLGEVLCAPIDVVLADDMVVQPDIVFIAKKTLHYEKRVFSAPRIW